MALLVLASCKGSHQERIERGHDPWVIRATLDERPRMLILALRKDFWVAYDTERAALYNVSPRSINFDGAVYNTHHGPQPSSQGAAALLSVFPEPWHLLRGSEDVRPKVQYRGHRFDGSQVVLRYTLTAPDGARIEIEERPEANVDNAGIAHLERTFTTRGVPAGLQLAMDFNAPDLAALDNVSLATKENGLTGKLLLRAAGETRMVITLKAPEVKAQKPSASTQPEGQRLIGENDCATCHNPNNHTVGPSYKEIAEHYRTNPDTISGLAAKIRQGGSDQWGDVAMVSHPTLAAEDATTIASYILSTFDPKDALGEEASHPLSANAASPPDFDPAHLRDGVAVEVFETGHPVPGMPLLSQDTSANLAFTATNLVFDEAHDAFKRSDKTPGFIARIRGWLRVSQAGDYDLRLDHDGRATLQVDGQLLITDADSSARRWSDWASSTLKEGIHPFELVYASGTAPYLALHWQPPQGKLLPIPKDHLKALPVDKQRVVPGLKSYTLSPGVGGDARPLTRVHPSFVVRQARPHGFKPMVGGLDFLPSGRLLVSTWDERGSVYELDHLDAKDPEQINVRRIADGLSEPLGLKVVEGQIYVLQKHELTRLVDHDRDGLIDDYQTVSNGWGATSNFHEFAFGLAYREGYFYATLAIGIEPGGAAMSPQHPDRGKVLRIAKDTGAIEHIARGLRTPNGIGFDAHGELFVTDNEGDWLPANKLVHVQPDAFFGSYSVSPEVTKNLPVRPPVVWLPVDEMANSPSQPLPLDIGPYHGQLLYGDVTYGGLSRVVLQKVADQYQGCVLPFTQGFEAGINRAAIGPDGSIYVGGIGNPGNWAQEGKLWYGLQRLSYTGAPTFEMLDVQLRSDGIEITFTEPLRAGSGNAPSDYSLKQWHYVPTAEYGGPKLDEHVLGVQHVHVSPDRRRVFLVVSGIQTGHVVHVQLANPPIAESEREIWATDAYCTINNLPHALPGERFAGATGTLPNTLTPAELGQGTRLLFDGKTLNGWKGYHGKPTTGWKVQRGMLSATGKRGVDLINKDELTDFDLELEWKVAKGANSGVFYRATEAEPELWRSALEMQIVDDEAHEDGRLPLHRSGSAYDLVAPGAAVIRKAGEFNHSRIVARGTQVEHWLNGHKILAYDTSSAEWKLQLGRSKFADVPGFGSARGGHIGLQHHGSEVAFRSIKVRGLTPH